MYVMTIRQISADDLKNVLVAAGFPGAETVDALRDGSKVTAFIDAARNHIAKTRCGHDAGSWKVQEVPTHEHGNQRLHGPSVRLELWGGDRHGFEAHRGFNGSLDVLIYVADTGASSVDSEMRGAIDEVTAGITHRYTNVSNWGEIDEELEAA